METVFIFFFLSQPPYRVIGGTGADITATRALFFSVHVQLVSNFELMVGF
jgi:hypothetical protein